MDGAPPEVAAPPPPTPEAAPPAPTIITKKRGAAVRADAAPAPEPAATPAPDAKAPPARKEGEHAVEARQKSINPYNISAMVAKAATKLGVDLEGEPAPAEPSTPPAEAPADPEAPTEPAPAAAAAETPQQAGESEQDYRIRLEVRKRVRDFERRDREAARHTAEARRVLAEQQAFREAAARGDVSRAMQLAGIDPEAVIRAQLGAPDPPTEQQQLQQGLAEFRQWQAQQQAQEQERAIYMAAGQFAQTEIKPMVSEANARQLLKAFGSADNVSAYVMAEMHGYHTKNNAHFPGGIEGAIAALERFHAEQAEYQAWREGRKNGAARPAPPPAITNRMAPAPGTSTQAEMERRTSGGTILRGSAAKTHRERIADAERRLAGKR